MSQEVIIRTKCTYCKESNYITVDKADFKAWQSGELIQRIWPEWTADQREQLISGTHEKCWNAIFWQPEEGPEDNEND